MTEAGNHALPSNLPRGAAFEDGLFTQVLRPGGRSERRPALFLDRDGAVVVEAHYLHKVEDVELIPGAAATIAAANAMSIPVIFVTNQAGIGYGYFGWPDFFAVQDRIFADLAAEGAYVDGVFACPFHEKGRPPYDRADHPARKPNPGMLLAAARRMNIDLSRSWIVGDRAGDLAAGKNAGIAGGIHVLTGHGRRDGEHSEALALADAAYRTLAAPSIAEVPGLTTLV